MFGSCSSLESLDLANFNTEKVTNMNSMFTYCDNLRSLDVSNFNTSNVTDMSFMFSDCPNLAKINLGAFKTENVTTIYGMFYKCSSIVSLDLSSFDLSKCTNAEAVTMGCDKLEFLNLGNNDFSKIDNAVFYGTGSTTKPCQLIETFGREPLGNVTIDKDNQVPPYYKYGSGYFTIAETLDTEKDYTPTTKDDADLWVKGRTMKGNVWNSMVLPVGVTQEQLKTVFGDDVKVCTLTGYDGKNVMFTTLTGSTTANTPVLVMPSSEIKNVGFAAVNIVNVGSDAPTAKVTKNNITASFIGSYKQMITIGNDCYYYYDGQFLCSAGNSKVPNTRGYFKFSDGGTAAKIFVLDNNGMVTGINAIDGKPVGKQEPVYNLAGQRVGKDYKGIVIISGKKVLRK